jgi:uroporphyrinogen decarboxylase
MDALADLAIDSLRSQIDQGAAALQLFDSWAGALSPQDYERFVLPSSTKVLSAFADAWVPRIHFGVNTSELYPLIASAGAEVVGVDWRTPLDVARTRVPAHVGLQGNLDPAIVAAGWGPTPARSAPARRSAARSGACAAVAILVRQGRVDRAVRVDLPGGTLGTRQLRLAPRSHGRRADRRPGDVLDRR